MYVIHCKDNLYYPKSLIFSEKNTLHSLPSPHSRRTGVLIIGGLEYS